MVNRFATVWALAVAVAMTAACTVHQSDSAPALTGPSDFAQSISITSNPDRLTQDGQSQSAITIRVFDSTGSPATNVPVRVDMLVGGVLQDFGTLSARNVVTLSDGRATVVYTAPPAPPPSNQVSGTVTIRAIAVGTNAQSSNPFSTDIRLVPPGVILPPGGTPTASFTVSPTPASANVLLNFDASASLPGTGATSITTYAWTFGDGSTGSGRNATHTYTAPNTYNVTLTVTNDRGIAASTTQAITVGTTTAPTAAFTFSPAAPAALQDVNFNAAASSAAPGRTLISYNWNFGDGTLKTGVTTQHDFDPAGTYNVTLTVTDDAGQKSTATQAVTVTAGVGGTPTPPTPSFTFSPASPGVNENVNFNASASTAGPGRTIVQYFWTFGDGTSIASTIPTGMFHPYSTAGTYSVQLRVTDNATPPQSVTSAATTITVGSPPSPTANFTSSPTPPVVGQAVVFDASSSTTAQGQTITRLDWNFGDATPIISCPGDPACNGTRIISHVFSAPATYTVNLVVTDSAGRTGSRSATVIVGANNPTARLTLTKSGGLLIIADGSQSTPAPFGTATITTYTFNWGDFSPNTSSSSPSVAHLFPVLGTYTVTLTVTDNFVPPRTSAPVTQTITVP